MKKSICLLVLLGVVLACENEPDKLTISKFKITNVNGQSIIKIDEKGNITKNGDAVGYVKKNGIIADKKGRTILKLGKDETQFLDNEGKPVIRIYKDGQFTNSSGELIQWSDAGELMKGKENTGITIYPTERGFLQIASVLLYLYYIV
ncbi:hypothetical protein FIA58_019420 [Flavobacterium jejuense]|uniref:Uncharacterized protein n=1 Tax=Flavobacterium jejuense TaxID=1544455 RepID=A0ABX0IZ71_9FLAO|nr:hypothetical protein [Flavobacterium jejuense]NHN27853.1 hypothetical protein [Flavobacterium jejuense]